LTLIITSKRSLPPSRLLFSFSSHLAASLSLAGSFVFSSASTPALLYVDTLHFSFVFYPFYFTVAPALSLSVPLLLEQMGRKRTAEDYHRIAEENDWVAGGPMKRRIVYSKRRMSLRTDTNRTNRRL
jgi:hypothetical protein